jgi:hypothetical protein
MIRTRGTVLVYKTYGFPSLGPKVLPLTKITNLNLICKIHTPVAYHEASTNTFFFYCSPGIKHNLFDIVVKVTKADHPLRPPSKNKFGQRFSK